MIDYEKLALLKSEMDGAHTKLAKAANRLFSEGEESPGFLDKKLADDVFILEEDFRKKYNSWLGFLREIISN